MLRPYVLILLSGLAPFVFTACGKKETAAPAAAAAPAPTPAPQPAAEPAPAAAAAAVATPAPAARVVEVTGNDSMKFNVTRIEAVAGSQLTITFKNVGTLPKVAMGHNLVVLQKGTNATAFSNAAAVARATDYIPPTMAGQIVAHTKMLGPKEEDSITFTVPATPGNYDYLCSFPAHFLAGMKGVLVVTAAEGAAGAAAAP